MSFRYYLYISDAKVDMLLSQTDPGWARKRTSEVGLDLKVVTARRSVESASADRVARLERVVRFLQDHGDIGDVDEPGQYFGGLLPMQWGLVGDDDTVYFGGRTRRTILGLGGASAHVLGAATRAAADAGAPPPPAPDRLSASLLPVLLHRIATPADDDFVLRPAAPGPQDALAAADTDALATVAQANSTLRGPAQHVEFLAKRLLSGPSPYPELHGDRTVLLGTPLYVALAD
ncbi:SAVMC3_10250 family protein [Streptomyces uncialis]|uniref:DUF7019 family protein n=1 Tax=Streptomyces uncialis TaxID=1048205 RepID=UPI002E35BF52|nr:SAVMC3_10250 family protein [Streptomyces uncialis]